MKPLTIEELKSLEVGDWVWLCGKYENFGEYSEYRKIEKNYEDCLTFAVGVNSIHFKYSDYGKTWIAYKNKEQAETNGDIIELPCERKTKSTLLPYEVVYINEYDKVVVERFTYENDAKFRLAKLKGEV